MTNIMRINIKYHAYSEPHVPVPATATEASKIDFYLRLSKPATSNISLNRHLWHFRDVPATGICGGTLIWKPLPATSKPVTSRIRLYRHLWHFRDVPVTGTCGGNLSWKPLPATSKLACDKGAYNGPFYAVTSDKAQGAYTGLLVYRRLAKSAGNWDR